MESPAIQLGRRNVMRVVRETGSGLYLDAEQMGEVLLPGRYAPRGLQPNQRIEVFLYRDSEDRLVATTEKPLAMVGEFACLCVNDLHPSLGAFLDWGLAKDLLLPRTAQTGRLERGDVVPVFIKIDSTTDRIVACARINDYLSESPPAFGADEPVKLLVVGRTPLGYRAVINNAQLGLLYHTDLARELEIGERLDGFVRIVREDGKIDLALDRVGYARVADLAQRVLAALAAGGGKLSLDDGSAPDEIREAFGVSKGAFKQAIGRLFRERKIALMRPGIELLPRHKGR